MRPEKKHWADLVDPLKLRSQPAPAATPRLVRSLIVSTREALGRVDANGGKNVVGETRESLERQLAGFQERLNDGRA